MTKKITLTLLAVLCIGSFSLLAQTKGQSLPNIEIKDLNGKAVNIGDFSKNGKATVLSFWATWCNPCIKELNNIADLYEDWVEDYNVELVAISIDDARNAAKVKPYINGQGWDYEVLLDPNSDLKRVLNFQTVPFTILVSPEGKIVYRHTGYTEGHENILEDEIEKVASK